MVYLGDRDLRVEARAIASTITPYQSPSQERDKHVYRHVQPMVFRTYRRLQDLASFTKCENDTLAIYDRLRSYLNGRVYQ